MLAQQTTDLLHRLKLPAMAEALDEQRIKAVRLLTATLPPPRWPCPISWAMFWVV